MTRDQAGEERAASLSLQPLVSELLLQVKAKRLGRGFSGLKFWDHRKQGRVDEIFAIRMGEGPSNVIEDPPVAGVFDSFQGLQISFVLPKIGDVPEIQVKVPVPS